MKIKQIYRNSICFLVSILLVVATSTSAFSQNNNFEFVTNTPNGVLPHLVHYPSEYDSADPSTKYPLLLFFHGAGQKGNGSQNELLKVANTGLPKAIKDGKYDSQLPFIVIAPQLPSNHKSWWKSDIEKIFDYAVENYNVDSNKIYTTGLSLGGAATWESILYRGSQIAAAVPIAAWKGKNKFDIDICDSMKHIGVWAFHGENDTNEGGVSYPSGVGAVNLFNQNCSPNPPAKLTTYPGVGHNVWDRTYDNSFEGASEEDKKNLGGDGIEYNSDIYNWLLSFKLGNSNPPPSQKITLANEMISSTNSANLVDKNAIIDEQELVGDPLRGDNYDATSQVKLANANGGKEISLNIDLGAEYFIDTVAFYDRNGKDTFTVSSGTPGNFNSLFSDDLASYKKWKSKEVKVSTRYLNVKQQDGYKASMPEIVLYGYKK